MKSLSLTLRVYGLLICDQQILLSRENIKGSIYTKFPGGGLEPGEGVVACLKREFSEEVNIELSGFEHFYTTEDYFTSAFHNSKQVISIYYRVWTEDFQKIHTGNPENTSLLKNDGDQILYWCPLNDLLKEPIHLPIDRIVAKAISQRYKK